MFTLFKSIKLILPLIVFCALIGCDSEDAKTRKMAKAAISPSQYELTIDIPELLDRPERVQMGKEWENVQNYYGSFSKSMRSGNEAEEAQLNMAVLFTQEARVTGEHGHYYPAALELLEDLLQKKLPNQDLKFRALSTKAGVQLSQHDFKGALETGQKAVKINPYNAQIYGVLTDAYVELGDYEKAVKMADKMVEVRPDLRSYSRISYLREIYGMPEDAIEAMEMAVKAGYPGYEETAWARLQLGQLHERYGKLKDAEMHYKIILAERPDYPFAIAALGDLELKRKNYETAERYLQEASQIIPEVGYFESLAHVYKAQENHQKSEELTREIFTMLQDDIDSGHNMNLEYAAVYSELADNPEKALEFLQKEYELRPNNIDVNLELAKVYFKTGQVEKAKKHLETAQKTNSKNPELLALFSELN